MPAVETATEAQTTVADTQALEELTRAVQDNEIALTKLERAQWEKTNEPQPAQQTPQAQQVAKAERTQFAKQMLDKYKPDWQKSAKPMAQVAQKAQPKPMAKVLEKAAKFKGEKKSLKAEREVQKQAKAKKTTTPAVEDAELLHQGEEMQSPNVAPQMKEQFDLADENARLDDIYPEYPGETIVVDGKERPVYNSEKDENGNYKRIAKSAEALTNFWRWFGDSKVVDEQGRPLVVYHGTPSGDFDTFYEDSYFTADKEYADSYQHPSTSATWTGKKTTAPKTFAVYLRINNPFTTTEKTAKDIFEKEYTASYAPVLAEDGNVDWTEAQDLIPFIKEQHPEYDGILLSEGGERGISYVPFEPNQIKSVDNRGTYSSDTGNILKQSKVEGTGSDKYRGAYDEKLKRIILGEKSDLTTIQHEFAHYWIQNNFKWARSGLASQDWLRRWRDVEEALDIDPQDRYLSRQASEKFARAYERYIMEGKVADDLKWAFDGFQKFYNDIYEDLQNEYFDLSEELNPAIVDWFNRQRPVTEEQLKQDAYKRVAEVAMSQGAEISTPVADGISTVSSMNQKGEIETSIVVSDKAAKGATLAEYTGKTKNRRTIEGLRESNPDIESDKYKEVSNKGTVKNATRWVETDTAGAWAALNDSSENWINRSALFEAFKSYAENGHPEVGIELSKISFPKEVTELGQALSLLSERAEFDPLTILEFKEKSTGTLEESVANEEINDMAIGEEETDPTEEQIARFKKQTECKL
jgi:hypothetical protein